MLGRRQPVHPHLRVPAVRAATRSGPLVAGTPAHGTVRPRLGPCRMTSYTDAEALAETIRDDLYDELEHGVGVISHGDLYQVDDAVDDELILVGEASGRRFLVTVHVDVRELDGAA